jgi:hypothetical protein
MTLREYFENTKGTGVLATADGRGKVDAAIYARPHVMEDGSLAFIMLDRLTHKNLESNPNATYLFLEDGGRYRGVRLFLEKIREDNDPDLISRIARKCPDDFGQHAEGTRFLVYFRLEKILDLIGPGVPDLQLPR